jgi:ribonuclease Z
MRASRSMLAILYVFLLVSFGATAKAAPCVRITLTGTMSGPVLLNGIAGAGTSIRYGDDTNSCSTVVLQFDAGRGTSLRLSQMGIDVAQLDAIFLTHVHSDHVDGLADVLQARWNWNSTGQKLDIVCSVDTPAQPLPFTMSCRKLITHIADAYIQSGEIAQRVSEDKRRLPGGPTEITNLTTFIPSDERQIVWTKGDVRVSAVRSPHVAGHSIVIGGDAGNDIVTPPRASSTSAQVEKLAQGADVIVHSTMHPIMAPDRGSGMPPAVFYRQSTTTDLGAMAVRAGAKYLMLTHLAPQLNQPKHGPWNVPNGSVTEADYREAAKAGGFNGNIIVGTDLVTLQLPAK